MERKLTWASVIASRIAFTSQLQTAYAADRCWTVRAFLFIADNGGRIEHLEELIVGPTTISTIPPRRSRCSMR
jgi:hypothetical protein